MGGEGAEGEGEVEDDFDDPDAALDAGLRTRDLGGSAGTVNYIPIRANATRSISQATFRADSYGGVRGTFDFNRPLIAQKLALRVAAVEEAKGFVRKPSSEKISRLQGLVLFCLYVAGILGAMLVALVLRRSVPLPGQMRLLYGIARFDSPNRAF